jgi:4a-hydroxytetrahydrobiopterin dehydratase
MATLLEMHCTACDEQTAPLTEEAIATWRQQVPDWQVREAKVGKRLECQYDVNDFAQALAFATAIGALAEAEFHHPKLIVAWGQVSVQWWTHQVQGLHLNDFIMAAKTDDIYHEGGYQAMPSDAIVRRWEAMRKQTLQWWRDLTGKDLPDIEEDRDRLMQLLQDKYDYSEAEANDELGRRINDYQRFVV